LTENAQRSGTHFRLRPFISGSLAKKLSISGSLVRTAGSLLIEYKVRGWLEGIKWPSNSSVACRRHRLWRHTCFEFFCGIQGETGYWEVNLCPSGCWNVYRFDGYRSGMREEGAVGPPTCRVAAARDLLSLACTVNFNGIIEDSSTLELGLGSVIEATDGSTGYWAIDHPGAEPDFHDRRGFVLVLPGVGNADIHGENDEESARY
jgi:hypothetical protein